MSALVTDDMVEAAAIALRNQTRERVGLSPLDRLPWSPASGEARADARAAIEAAAPAIAAKALRDAADELRRLDDGRTGGYYEAGRHIIQRLDARADRIERGESRARADEIATRDV